MSFATLTDFDAWGFPRVMWATKEVEVTAGLDAAQGTMLEYFRSAPGIVLPIAEALVTDNVRQKECWIAAYSLMSVIGFDPGSDPDKVIESRYNKAMAWLRDVQKGTAKPFPMAPETPDPDDTDTDSSGAGTASAVSRNWDCLLG